jgi:hypothetical protein
VMKMRRSSRPNRIFAGPNSLCPTRESTKKADITVVAMLMILSSLPLSRTGSLHSVAVMFFAVRPSLTVHFETRHCSTVDCSLASAHTHAVSNKLQSAAVGVPLMQANYRICEPT